MMLRHLLVLLCLAALCSSIHGKSSNMTNNSSVSSLNNSPISHRSAKMYTLFGYDFTLPSWMDKVKNALVGPSGLVTKIKAFLKGDSSVSTNLFGKKVNFRAQIPSSKAEATQSVSIFFSKISSDATTRLIFVIYLNIVVMVLAYTVLFIKQVQLHRRQMREETDIVKQKKMDKEEKRALRSERGEGRRGSVRNRREMIDEDDEVSPSINWTDMVAPSVVKMCDEGTVDSRPVFPTPRLLVPEMFSPMADSDKEYSLDSTQVDCSEVSMDGALESALQVKADVHAQE